MQLRMQKTSLLDAIQRVVGVVDKKNTISVLSNILFRPDAATNTVKLTATNLEIGATCGAIMERAGSCYKCPNCGSTSGCS